MDKESRKIYMKKYRIKFKEKYKNYFREYHNRRKADDAYRERRIENSKKWVKNNPEKRKITARKFYELNKEYFIKKNKEYRINFPERHRLASLEYAKKNKRKLKIHRICRQALKDGIIKKQENCENCKTNKKRLIKHHPDYRSPLRIVWLCDSCHYRIHHS